MAQYLIWNQVTSGLLLKHLDLNFPPQLQGSSHIMQTQALCIPQGVYKTVRLALTDKLKRLDLGCRIARC